MKRNGHMLLNLHESKLEVCADVERDKDGNDGEGQNLQRHSKKVAQAGFESQRVMKIMPTLPGNFRPRIRHHQASS